MFVSKKQFLTKKEFYETDEYNDGRYINLAERVDDLEYEIKELRKQFADLCEQLNHETRWNIKQNAYTDSKFAAICDFLKIDLLHQPIDCYLAKKRKKGG